MAVNRSALTALKKLESDRAKLDTKQRELETKAATELGRMLLGSGMENFAPKNLKLITKSIGKMGEERALAKLNSDGGSNKTTL